MSLSLKKKPILATLAALGATGSLFSCVAPPADDGPRALVAAQAVSTVTFADISAGRGPASGRTPFSLLDEASSSLLVVTDDGSHGLRPGLFRCALDGSGCVVKDISAGEGEQSGFDPVAVIDRAAGKLLTVAENVARDGKPWLFRCELDGTGCTASDLSAGQGPKSGLSPSIVVDAEGGKLLVVTRNDDNGGRSALFRCELDGSSCQYVDISAGQGPSSGWSPSAAIDPIQHKLLVAARNAGDVTNPDGTKTVADMPVLLRCELDGSGCEVHDISAGQGFGCGISPVLLIDAQSQKLLVVTQNFDVALAGDQFGKLALFRCDLDGTGCVFADIAAGQGAESGQTPSALIDPTRGELVVATWDLEHASFPTHFGDPALYRCALDGTGCSYRDLSPGIPREFGYTPVLRLDAAHDQLLIVATTADEHLGLLSMRERSYSSATGDR
jgi:hypothetical protein